MHESSTSMCASPCQGMIWNLVHSHHGLKVLTISHVLEIIVSYVGNKKESILCSFCL